MDADAFDVTFGVMPLRQQLLQGIKNYGFKKPFAIQQKGILPLCEGRDIMICEEPQTGKTTTFCCGILQRLNYGPAVYCQAIIMSYTEEEAERTRLMIWGLGENLGVNVGVINLNQPVSPLQIVIGTPVSIYNALERHAIEFNRIKTFILDDADEILLEDNDMVHHLLRILPPQIQLGISCKGITAAVREVVMNFLKDPVKVFVRKQKLIAEGLQRPGWWVSVIRDKGRREEINVEKMDCYGKLELPLFNRDIPLLYRADGTMYSPDVFYTKYGEELSPFNTKRTWRSESWKTFKDTVTNIFVLRPRR